MKMKYIMLCLCISMIAFGCGNTSDEPSQTTEPIMQSVSEKSEDSDTGENISTEATDLVSEDEGLTEDATEEVAALDEGQQDSFAAPEGISFPALDLQEDAGNGYDHYSKSSLTENFQFTDYGYEISLPAETADLSDHAWLNGIAWVETDAYHLGAGIIPDSESLPVEMMTTFMFSLEKDDAMQAPESYDFALVSEQEGYFNTSCLTHYDAFYVEFTYPDGYTVNKYVMSIDYAQPSSQSYSPVLYLYASVDTLEDLTNTLNVMQDVLISYNDYVEQEENHLAIMDNSERSDASMRMDSNGVIWYIAEHPVAGITYSADIPLDFPDDPEGDYYVQFIWQPADLSVVSVPSSMYVKEPSGMRWEADLDYSELHNFFFLVKDTYAGDYYLHVKTTDEIGSYTTNVIPIENMETYLQAYGKEFYGQ